MKKARKLISLLLVLIVTASAFAGTAVFAADTNGDFAIENGVLTQYTGNGGDVTIPDGVTSIGDYAFCWCSNISNIVIPSSVTSIGCGAFSVCTGLASISIPKSVTSIGDGAFSDCTQLATVTIPNSVTGIGENAFARTPWLNNYPNDFIVINGILVEYKGTDRAIVIPEGTTRINDNSFESCSNVTDITIPTGVTSIGDNAFVDCTGLKNITIPSSVTSIGNSAFYNCTGLTNIVIPGSVTSIGNNAFVNCTGLTGIVIPNGVTSMGDNIFIDCTALTSVTLPNTITNIGDFTFYDCSNLTNINIPSSVTSIGDSTFYDCSNLTNVVIPNSVSNIGDEAFAGCTQLSSITIPASVVSFDDNIFYKTKVTINCYENTRAQAYAKKYSLPFQLIGEMPVTPTIIIHNGIAYNGSVMFDTQSYNMAPTNRYDVGVKLAGNGNTKTIKITSSRDGIATVRRLPNGNYRVIGANPGTTYILCTIYDGTKEITHASIKVTVAAGVKQGGVATRNTSYFN